MKKTILETCTNIMKEAKNMVVLTGAGISTESGIKDFRSSQGLYQLAPEYVLSLDYFYQHPKEFYEFAIENLYHPQAQPNQGHKILAKWEQEGKVSSIITQNIDGLHQKAGSKDVIEFHGTIESAKCINCGKNYTTNDLIESRNRVEDFFICNHCQTEQQHMRYIKPDVVLYGDAGEWFTPEGFSTIVHRISGADCILVLGTSLKVTPFSHFPTYRLLGVPMIIINKGDTPYDRERDTYVIQDSIGKTLQDIAEHIK
ncbi:NAD-dependent protein deacylase [Niallia sp. Krafla_26]|uniref:NAD-dependent protein deacylase n=1 Tax=Niallia sp. Krafla_26 TaxID=3064703 RepID=UPI003D1865D1